MPKRSPTNAELEILRVLWQRGPSTVRDVHESLDHAKPVGYTTVLKLLQIMVEKGLATRDASARSHVYAAVASEGATQRRMVADLVRRVFGGSTLGLVLHALESTPATSPELDQLRRLLDEKNGGRT
jgi:BlaI family transcriptional regulator, penicillinase repressor